MTKQLTIGEVCDFIGGSQPPKSTFKYKPEEGYVRLIQTRDYKGDGYVTALRQVE
jgi:type I restriction enzyme S subunit